MTRAAQPVPRSTSPATPHQAAPEPRVPDAGTSWARGRALAGAVACVVGLAGAAFLWHRPPIPKVPETTAVPGPARVVTIEPRPVTITLTVLGTVAPGRTVAVISPFDGVVRQMQAGLGATVEADDVLLTMDSGEIESRFREALTTVLKAQAAYDSVMGWENSPDMQRVRRALDTGRAALTRLESETASLKTLLDKGIVSRREYEGAVQQHDAQAAAVAGFQVDLAATSARGSRENQRAAELELENAKARAGDLKRQLDGATVVAPASGFVMRPPVSAAMPRGWVPVEPGTRLTRGDPIYSIADLRTFMAAAKVDEVDVNRVRSGQAVSISSDAFPGTVLAGTIASVGVEASPSNASDRRVLFDVRASFAPTDEGQRSAIRIGMSIKMSITIFSAAEVLVAPIGSIERGEPPTVTISDPVTGARRKAPVSLGPTTEDGVVVLSGLRPGEQVVVR